MNRHFHVAVCCYPTEEEKAWRVEENSLHSSVSDESYSYKHVLTESEGHVELYERAVSPLIASALKGHDAFIVAYGLPRTGKTHAVFGPSGQARAQRQTRGVISRVGQQIFDTVSDDRVCKVSASFCQVFEDGRVMDLYDSRRRPLDLLEDGSTNTFSVPSLTEHPVCSSLDLTRLTVKANIIRNASGCRRDIGTPATPQQSWYKPHSSHAITSVVVERLKIERDDTKEGGNGEIFARSQITIVDLAGHSIGLVQAGQPCPDSGIHTLHQIMTTLPSHGMVAASGLFPQSPLTKLLKPCLGGNSMTLLIGTLSLSEASMESSKRSLQVLQKASQIKNYSRPSQSILSDSSLGRTLQQITDLRNEVCAEVGATPNPQTWEVGQGKNGDYIKINGRMYSELSSPCSSLVQRVNKMESQIVRKGVVYKQEKLELPAKMMPTVVSRPPAPTKPPHMIKPVVSTTPQPTDSLSSSSLNSDTSDEDLTSPPSSTTSGPPPPPLRGIPHVKPDSHFIPPRQVSKALPKAWRPLSGHSHHEHSLASSSQVSTAVSSWSETATSRSSSMKPVPTLPHPLLPLSRPPLPLHGSVQPVRLVKPVHVQPMGLPRPVLSLQPARPVFPLPVIRPRLLSQEAAHTSQPPATMTNPLLTSISEKPDQPFSQPPTLDLPRSAPCHSHPSTPGSLTPNPGSPALTPSPSPILTRSNEPPEISHSPLTTSRPQLPPHYLPPLSSPINLPSRLPHSISEGRMTSSSSSLTLTDSDLSQEARDTFDPVIRNRALSMQRTAPPYNGLQISGTHSTNPTSVVPPYNNSTHQRQVGGEGRESGEGGDMSEYTSREEIHVAAMEGIKSSQLKKLAIQYGVDYRDHGGRTPLMYAVLGNQPRMCDAFLNLGAKVNARDNAGLTPLLWATFQAKPQCMKILLRNGADIHIRDAEGRSVFHWAVKTPNLQCLKILQCQATPTIVNTADNEGLTPLHWAVLCKQAAHTHLLLTSAAADVSIQDGEGRTALTHAVLNSCSSCIKVILEVNESAVNQRDDKGRIVLHYACAEGSTDCVRTLLTAPSCDLHSRDDRGTTPLHWAAAANQPSILQLLLRHGADRTIRDNDELTAVEHAEVRGHTECAHVLYNYGLRRPSSALSVASQVSVQTLPPPTLDKHGHVTLALPQRRFSLSHSSLPRPPADGQDHPDNSDTDHTHERDFHPNTLQQSLLGTDLQDSREHAVRRRRQWWKLLCGCNRRNNVIIPTSVT